jgi:hypothetical protein
MRAALLPTPGDPFMLAYWLRDYDAWRSEVDELLVFVNGQTDPDAVAYDRRIIEEHGGRMLYSPDSAGHDGALRRLLHETTSEYVVLCEDDAYVRHPVAVGEAFADIESGTFDIVGSPRHEDYAGQTMKWGTYRPGGLTELRHGLWPAFLFMRRADLLATDERFGDRRWDVGETVAGWGTVSPEACRFVGIASDHIHLDTLFGTTFQLRARGLTTRLVHHVRLYDAKATEDWLAEDPPWFHVTGISTLMDALTNDPSRLPDMDAHGGLWTRRLAWWYRIAAQSDRPDTSVRLGALMRFAASAGIDPFVVSEWQARFDAWAPVVVPA